MSSRTCISFALKFPAFTSSDPSLAHLRHAALNSLAGIVMQKGLPSPLGSFEASGGCELLA